MVIQYAVNIIRGDYITNRSDDPSLISKTELQSYCSIVGALQILDITKNNQVGIQDYNLIGVQNGQQIMVSVKSSYMDKFNPQVGGYFVFIDEGDELYYDEEMFKNSFFMTLIKSEVDSLLMKKNKDVTVLLLPLQSDNPK